MKQGSSIQEDNLHSSSSLSPCSPNIPPLWDIPMACKGPPLPSNTYINSFGPWYQQPQHQDAMGRPPVIWERQKLECQTISCALFCKPLTSFPGIGKWDKGGVNGFFEGISRPFPLTRSPLAGDDCQYRLPFSDSGPYLTMVAEYVM